MEQSENLPALSFRLLYLLRPLVIVLAALGACWAVRHRRPELAWAAWIAAWFLLSVGIAGLGVGYWTLLVNASVSAAASAGAVLTATLIIPWQEPLIREWSWSAKAAWIGRATFGVGVAWILLPVLHTVFLMALGLA